jgi:microcystin degradation protein MlrC
MLSSHTIRDTSALKPRRVLIGQFFHETHGFNPQITSGAHVNVERGGALIAKARGGGTTLAGIIRTLERLNYDILPVVGMFAQPSGRLDHSFYAALRDELVAIAGAEDFDAVALDLHGAMGTTELSDADGDLLTRLRQAIGPDRPIAIGLDMHAHVTAAMLEAVDICIACKETPHTDFPECGHKLVEQLDALLAGTLHPVMAMAKAPMIHMDAGLTASGPLAEAKAIATGLAALNPAIRDISLFQVYRFGDYPEPKGQTALVLTDGDAEGATEAAAHLAGWFWDNRERFREEAPDIDSALDQVAARPGRLPMVLADTGDRTMAGAPGDGTAILERALNHPKTLRGIFPVNDASSVQACREAGAGATLSLAIGGRITPGFSPLPVTGVVTGFGDGKFTIDGPVFGGERCTLGATATLVIDDRLTILLTSEPGLTHTPAAFRSQGISFAGQDLIVSKSGQHFAANFAGVATPLIVRTPGLSHPEKGFFPWRNAQFWPEEDLDDVVISARIFKKQPYGARSLR